MMGVYNRDTVYLLHGMNWTLNIIQINIGFCGPGSSVGIATGYGVDGPGSNPGGDEIFCLSRPALGPTLLHNGHWVFPGGKVQLGRATDFSPPSSATVMEE